MFSTTHIVEVNDTDREERVGNDIKKVTLKNRSY